MTRAYSAAAEQNRQPVLEVLRQELKAGDHVLELGSGSGQHVAYFATALPEVTWQPTDFAECLPGIDSWTSESRSSVRPAMVLDVRQKPWPELQADICYTANTFHIMSLAAVQDSIKGCAELLDSGGKLCVYGPFSINGQHTSPSNQNFDQFLKQSDPESGVRDLTELDQFATTQGFLPARTVAMPANNLMVIWEKT